MEAIRHTLTAWYGANARKLPWRDTSDPYLIWLSEVILQQTRVDQGLEYYHRLSERYPDVRSLAAAREEELLKLWQGLGYYSRARNLHHAARQVVEEFGGRMPADHAGLLSLRGVGPYTAAAIASIAYGEPKPVIDGNVERVISRLFGIVDEKGSTSFRSKVSLLAEELLDRKSPGLFNQAMMEFGALQCTPRKPACASCPVMAYCHALKEGKVESIPVKRKRKDARERFFHYLAVKISNGDEVFILMQRRTGTDIWRNLWEFPLLEGEETLDPGLAMDSGQFSAIAALPAFRVLRIIDRKHVLSHQVIRARFIFAEADWDEKLRLADLQLLPLSRARKLPVSRLIEPALEILAGRI